MTQTWVFKRVMTARVCADNVSHDEAFAFVKAMFPTKVEITDECEFVSDNPDRVWGAGDITCELEETENV